MDRWPELRSILRDIAALGIGLYIAIRAGEPPITAEDVPAFTVAAGFLGLPLVVRIGKDSE